MKTKFKERAYCSKGKKSSSKPTTVVCKLLPFKKKKEALKIVKNLRRSDFFVNENFWWGTIPRTKEL